MEDPRNYYHHHPNSSQSFTDQDHLVSSFQRLSTSSNSFGCAPAVSISTPDLGLGNSYTINYGSQGFQNSSGPEKTDVRILKILCNSEEKGLLMMFLGSQNSFIAAVVQVAADAINTKLGSRAMQKILKVLVMSKLTTHIAYVMQMLKPQLLSMMYDPNGTRVIQCFLRYPNLEENKHIYRVAVSNCLNLATTAQGCISLKALIESAVVGPVSVELICTILNNAVILSGHCYGNYVVQHVLDHHPYVANHLCERIRGDLFRLSMDRHGSPVVEKCISSDAIDVVVSELLSDSKRLVELAQDMFGNYVVQKALKETKGRALQRYLQLIDILLESSSELEYHVIGRNVYKLISNEKSSRN